MLGGGIADKVGNEYEVRWTLVEALRVLRGLADEIRVEPFNEKAEGFEFRISKGCISQWHQCKRQRSSGSWTINALADAGVLQAFAEKLAESDTRVVFVSADPAPAFEKLIEKANVAETSADFYGEGGIGKGDQVALKELNAVWQFDAESQFSRLKRCSVEVTSDASLLRRLEELCHLLFKTEPGTAIDRLSRFLIAQLGQRLTTARLVEAVRELRIEWRAHFDETLDAKFAVATQEYLDTLSTKILGLELQTKDLADSIKIALDGPTAVTVVAGGAGSGKSVALSRMIAEARKRGWPVLAFRIDRYLNIESLMELGQAVLETPESPVGAFGNRNTATRALLVIDQVDAVSEASGRSGRIRELFFRMINDTRHFPSMRVVAACRSYDLEGDTRLEALSKAELVTAIRLKPLDWNDGVEPVLKHLGIDSRQFSVREKQLLAIPINLGLFASVIEAGEGMVGELSSTRLFDKLMKIRAQDLRLAGYAWTPEMALGAMAQSMSDNQELTAPVSSLDPFSGAVDALSSRGLITALGGKLQFAHESFFDHTFSRRFTTSGQSVHTLLISDEQRLFRRTQVRQIFSRLRDNSNRSYLENLRDVMEADDVRYLVKDAIAYWLGEVHSPSLDELAAVEKWFFPQHPLEGLARVVFNGKGWLQTLYQGGTLARWVRDGGAKKEFAFWLLNRGATTESDLVAQFMTGWWKIAPQERSAELIAWLEQLHPDGPIGTIETLYAEALDALPSTKIDEVFFKNFKLHSWVNKSRPLGGRILGFWIRKWMYSFPERSPFSEDDNDNDMYWVNQLAEHQPDALLNATIAPLADALVREQASLASGAISYPILRAPHYQYDQQFLRAIIRAFEALAVSAPEKVEGFLCLLDGPTEVELIIRLRTIAANAQSLAYLLVPLLEHPKIFEVGFGDGNWQPFAAAAAVAMPHLSPSDRNLVEAAVLAHRPELDWVTERARKTPHGELLGPSNYKRKNFLYGLTQSGRNERAILSTIGNEQLSELAQHRLAELERKFIGQPLPESDGMRGGVVRSPINSDKAHFMSDRQWLSAIRKYKGGERHVYDRDGVIGGAHELSRVLQGRAKDEPERFVRLLERLPAETNGDYAEAIISGLRESEADPSLVIRAVKAAQRWPAHDFGRTINWTIERHPLAGADLEILALLFRSAENGTASDSEIQTLGKNKPKRVTASELLTPDRDFISNGINGERGAAYEALSRVLWENKVTFTAILELLERQIESEPLISVRTCMVRTINSIGRYEPAKAAELLQRLAAKDLRILQGHAAQHMLGWIAHQYPDVVAGFIPELLVSKDRGLHAFGYFLESLLALLDDTRNEGFVAGFAGNVMRRQMAAYRGAGNVGSQYDERAVGWLLLLFDDRSTSVRSEAAHINWGKVLGGPTDRTAFARAYISSAAFNDQSGYLMRALEERVSQFPELTFEAVEKVLELSGDWTDDQRRGHSSTLYHLSHVLVELYRSISGNSAREKKILDLFDLYLAQDSYGLRGEIGAYERH